MKNFLHPPSDIKFSQICRQCAEATSPDFVCDDAVKSLYVMGGSAHKGNITPTAEFNFHCDPEAAFLVLKKVSCQS